MRLFGGTRVQTRAGKVSSLESGRVHLASIPGVLNQLFSTCRWLITDSGRSGSRARLAPEVDTFANDASGVAAVEFAMLAFPTILTILVIFSIGLTSLCSASLERAVVLTGRAITTGAVSPSSMTVSTLKTNIICPALISTINCDDVYVNIKTLAAGSFPSKYYSLVKSDQSGLIKPALDSSQDTFCPGSGSQYIVVELAYPAPLLASPLIGNGTATYNGNPVSVILATSTFLSEPYTGAATYSGC